jgi:hypothetical protein
VSGDQAYGLWPLVLLNSGLFIPAWTRYAVRSPGSAPAKPQNTRRHARDQRPNRTDTPPGRGSSDFRPRHHPGAPTEVTRTLRRNKFQAGK